MPRSSGLRRPDAVVLQSLRARIRRLEGSFAGVGAGADGLGVCPLGAPEIDDVLPWGGLPRAALHEILGAPAHRGAIVGFCAGLLARLAGDAGTVLWCRRGRGNEALYGPGLATFGLDAARLVVVRGRNATDVLWVMEEALRGGGLMAALGEIDDISITAARRLQLAAEGGGGAALLLRPTREKAEPGPAVTRWRVAPAPSAVEADRPGVGAVRWRLDLVKCRGTLPAAASGEDDGARETLRSWLVEWRDGAQANPFRVVADLRHRQVVEPETARGHGGAQPVRLAG